MIQSDAELPLFVVDASVAVQWYFDDEQQVALAREIAHDFEFGHIQLIEPANFKLEVGDAVRNAMRSSRVTDEHGRAVIAKVLPLTVRTVAVDDLLTIGFEAAIRYDCALYHGLYLALAEQADCPLVHTDRRLHNTLAGRFPNELWISDYVTRR